MALWGSFTWGVAFWAGSAWITPTTDRTPSDVARLKMLRTKINADGWDGITEAEQAEWAEDLKGAYNDSDLNRVGKCVQYLADLLNGYGYDVPVTTKTDWTIGDVPRSAQLSTYLSNLNTLKTAYYSGASLPDSMSKIGFSDANNIEMMLLNIKAKISRMLLSFWYCGEIGCGEV